MGATEVNGDAGRWGREQPSAPVLQLSMESGCSAYDCEFVHLAHELDVPLVTSDRRVLKAFPDVAVAMGDFE